MEKFLVLLCSTYISLVLINPKLSIFQVLIFICSTAFLGNIVKFAWLIRSSYVIKNRSIFIRPCITLLSLQSFTFALLSSLVLFEEVSFYLNKPPSIISWHKVSNKPIQNQICPYWLIIPLSLVDYRVYFLTFPFCTNKHLFSLALQSISLRYHLTYNQGWQVLTHSKIANLLFPSM